LENFAIGKRTPIDFLATVLMLQTAFCLTILADIPVARQVIGFLFLTFIPGYIILRILNTTDLNKTEVVVFSAGLSIAFLMLVGLLLNELLPLLGIPRPLSLLSPLIITINSFVFIGSILVYLKGKNFDFHFFETPNLFRLAIFLSILPILSIIGAMYVNLYGNNILLLLTIILILFLFIISVLAKNSLVSKSYPLIIFIIATSLLLHASLISNYIVSFGSDNPIEYYIFKLTESDGRWRSAFIYSWDIGYGKIYSMLSITILPTIYSALLNIDPTWIFKIVYPLIFSLVPLALYELYRKNLGEKRSFIAVFLFMAQNVFYTEILGLGRQMIAELFFVLLLLVVLNKKPSSLMRALLFIVFSFALVISHYALAEIFLLFISAAWIFLLLTKQFNRNITITIIVAFFTIAFAWYLYTSSSAVFTSFVSYGRYLYERLDELFNLRTRQKTVLMGLGLEPPPSIWNMLGRLSAYLTEILIVVGFVKLIFDEKRQTRKGNIIFAIVAMLFLFALIFVPGLANLMNMTRFYHVLLIFLAPLCVMGAETIVQLIFKRQNELLSSIFLLAVLGSYFLFQTGFVYELAGVQSWSLPLSKYRMGATFLRSRMGCFDEPDVVGAIWISKYMTNYLKVYADITSIDHVLRSYGMIYSGNTEVLLNVTTISPSGILFLNKANIIDGIIISWDSWNITDILSNLEFINKVYSNSYCEIYRNM